MSKAKDILHGLIDYALLFNNHRHRDNFPGRIVQRLSSDKRKELSELKSEEIKNLRFYEVDCLAKPNYESDMKMEFDKKCREKT